MMIQRSYSKPEIDRERQNRPLPADCLRALVVDDETIMVHVACRMLEALGFSVEAAHGSREELRALKKGGYDLLLTDLNMPHLNGFDLAGLFRRQSKEIRIVIMTGCAPDDRKVREAMLADTVDCWLFKPLDFLVLREKIGGPFRAGSERKNRDSSF